MIRRWASLFTLVIAVTFQFSVATATENGIEKPRRFIFLIHGLSGSEKTFGALPEVLKAHGALIQPNTEFTIVPVSYNTGSGVEDTYDFAHSIAKQMLKTIGTLRPTDRISLIAHSQGGLVSWIWYILSLSQEPGFKEYYQYAAQTEGLMTLGSPMWGSKLATFLKRFPKLAPFMQKHKMGPKELEEMSYASDTILRFRNRAVSLDRRKIGLPLRTYAVAGVVKKADDPSVPEYYRPLITALQEYVGSGEKYLAESDIAVSLPSARFDFIYLRDEAKASSSEIHADDFTFFNEARVRNFTIVQAPHASWQQSVFYDIAEVPEKCLDLERPCSHPTYPLILNFTMACTAEVTICNQAELVRLNHLFQNPEWKAERMPPNVTPDQMHSFILDLVLDVPEDYQLPRKEDVLGFLKFQGEQRGIIFNRETPYYYFKVDRRWEFQSHTVKVGQFKLNPPMSPLQKQIRVTMHGHVFENYDGKTDTRTPYLAIAKSGFKLPVMIELPGLPARRVELLVRPTYTTYLNLDYTK